MSEQMRSTREHPGEYAAGLAAFDLTGDLGAGVSVIEASAGTGKTYAIVGLATRYIAEGRVRLDQLLLVTFSRMATAELRERMRQRIAFTMRELADRDKALVSEDELVRLLAGRADAEQVHERLVTALAQFDAAVIATTHSLCQRLLDAMGFAGDREPDVVMVERIDELIEEVTSDVYISEFAAKPPPTRYSVVRTAARAAIFDPQSALGPRSDPDTDAGVRLQIAERVRAEVARRKRERRIRDFDDQLMLLRDCLVKAIDDGDEALLARLREPYRLVLVDEFQDTDPMQWDILSAVFGDSGIPLFLVGDPKQAIYGFRGAEVRSYLNAMNSATSRLQLDRNWRSSPQLLNALHWLYGGAQLGHEQIVVFPVKPARPAQEVTGPALRLRYLGRRGHGQLSTKGFPAKSQLRAHIAADVAGDIVDRLTAGGNSGVRPGDIAVLVGTNAQAKLVRNALAECGVPVVLGSGTNVFRSPAAQDWQWVLDAMMAPHRADLVRLAAVTALVGVPLADLATRGDEVVADTSGLLRDWAARFATAGMAAVLDAIVDATRLNERVLAQPDGERLLTDLAHIGDLLHAACLADDLGLAGLSRWLHQRTDQEALVSSRDRLQRLDTDADAVQVLTVHMSKGLEFGVVYVPFGWDSYVRDDETFVYHDEEQRRWLDVGGKRAAGRMSRWRRSVEEDADADLRLLYVAATRACSQVVLHWAPGDGTSNSPLHRMIFGKSASGALLRNLLVPDDAHAEAELLAWADGCADIVAEPVQECAPRSLPRPGDPALSASLRVARFERRFDDAWRRTSYSALTASAHDAWGGTTDLSVAVKDDEPDIEDDELPADTALGAAQALPSPMNGLGAGTAFGTVVHEILEVVDTSALDLDAEVNAKTSQVVAANVADVDAGALAAALSLVLRTPLGYGTLADIPPRDRLAELDFEFPLAGGDKPSTARVSLGQIAELLRRHVDTDDPLAGYADRMGELADTSLRGYLTGSIDLLARVGTGPDIRFVVIDYKTNRIVPVDVAVGLFDQATMAQEMLRSHYPLQALLYLVATHRYLRWRLPGYDPGQHLGGVQYLFLRGMAGPSTPAGCGVFSWRPPAALVVALSDLLAGGDA